MNNVLRNWFFLVLLLIGFLPSTGWSACPGCCSSHGGVSQSCGSSGRIICRDGTVSPSCTCSSCGVATSPVCTPRAEQRTLSCSSGQTGAVVETRNYSCSLGGIWSEWSVVLNTCASPTVSIAGRVISVTDGDTLTIQDTGSVFTVIRLAEVDAPEKCQPYGYASRNSLSELALNKAASVIVVEKDKYGRTVGKVSIPGQAETVNKSQLRRGMAWVYDYYVQDTSLDGIESAARFSNIGLWADSNPIEPWVWRQNNYGCSRDPESESTTTNSGAGSSAMLKVVEYHNSVSNHYFMTSNPAEADGIDAGTAGAGWSRTGNTFTVWPVATSEPGVLPVCRFYSGGANSHFFTVSPQECSGLRAIEVQQRQQATAEGKQFLGWSFEGMAYGVKSPSADGACPTGTEPIYRAYNHRESVNDMNHRFTPWPDDFDSMKAKGWTTEGVAMCASK